jgi:hypothetical protein
MRKTPSRKNEQLQVFDFVEAEFPIFLVFEFFLTTDASAVQSPTSFSPQRPLPW